MGKSPKAATVSFYLFLLVAGTYLVGKSPQRRSAIVVLKYAVLQ